MGFREVGALGRDSVLAGRREGEQSSAMNYRTQAEFFIKGITQGAVDAEEVIAWSDEVIVSAPKAEDWMVEISSCGPEDRLKILSLLNTVGGEADAAALAELLKARGLS